MGPVSRNVEWTPAGIKNWPNAVRLDNEFISLTIVPEAARVLSLRFKDRELFFVNKSEEGRNYAPGATEEWHNFGGTRFDAAPQSKWKDTPWGKEWPPPPILNSSRLMKRIEGGAELDTSDAVPNDLNLQISAKVVMSPNSTLVTVRQSITNTGNEQREWANWIVSQLAAAKGDSLVYVPHVENSAFEKGYVVMMGQERHPKRSEGSHGIRGILRGACPRMVRGCFLSSPPPCPKNINYGACGREPEGGGLLKLIIFPPLPDPLPQGEREKIGSETASVKSGAQNDNLNFQYDGTEWKAGFDKRGWIAFRPSEKGETVFVLLGSYKPEMKYPDGGCSVQYYSAGHMPYVEAELLGPLSNLKPSESAEDEFAFAVTSARGAVVSASKLGVITEPLHISSANTLSGSYGVFHRGTAKLVATDAKGKKTVIKSIEVSPSEPVVFGSVRVQNDKNIKYDMELYSLNKSMGTLDFLEMGD